jgi:hypothetical protein
LFKVFVPQSVDKKGINILPALEYGEIVVCWDGEQLMSDPFGCIRKIRKSMRNAVPGDYILCIGDPSVIALCAVVLSEKTGGYYKILKWDKQTKQYYAITIQMGIEDD